MNPRLAFVFPGQGSQSVGMLSELAAAYALVGETFHSASEVLGYDLWRIVADGPAERLDETAVTQPAMLAAGVAVWRIWRAQGGARPAAMAGHSLGEYTALVCAGALAFESAVRLVAERGRFMQQAVPRGEGAMAAILGLEDGQVAALCADAARGATVSAVNFNAPGQVVVAGAADAVARVAERAKAAGAKRAVLLPVSVPSHCALMAPAAENLRMVLRDTELRPPEIPVIHNVDVASYGDPERIRDALVRQLSSPVRWVESVRALVACGADTVLEAGPGKVLTGLNKRIDRDLTVLSVYDPATLGEAMERVRCDA